MHPLIEQRRSGIAELCRRYHVRRLEVFGSVARGSDFDPERSDIDFLVEFDPQHGTPSLSAFFKFQEKLVSLLGRPVDLVMEGSVRNPYVRAEIQRSRVPVYAP
ncbi:nucleotidyltransferase family protein [soil metagenome]